MALVRGRHAARCSAVELAKESRIVTDVTPSVARERLAR